jgi:AAHS family 3-hydroxyphenylpropionic acid transporter
MTSPDSASSGRRTLWLCTAAALLEGFDNQTMGVAAPRLIAEFHLSAAQSGTIFSSATIGLFFGALIGGRVADHIGRKRALTVSLLLFGVCSLLTAAAGTIEGLFAARLLTGFGLGGAMPNFISLASESTRADRRVSAVTLVMAGMPCGGALAGLMALGAQWGWGWRSIFVAGGAAPMLLAILVGVLMSRGKTRSGTSSASAGSSASAATPVESVPAVLFGSGRAWTTVLLWAAFFFTQLVLLLMLNWLPSLIVGLGYTRTEASWASICFNLSGSAGAAVLGLLHAGARRRLWVTVTYAGMAGALAAVASVGTNFPLIALACAGAGMFIVGAQLTLFALAPLYYHVRIRGTGVGAAVAAGRLGSVVGPLFAGGLLAGGGGSAAVLLAIVPFVAVGGGAAFALTWRSQTLD